MQRSFSLLLVLLYFTVRSPFILFADDTDLFIKACQNSGYNSGLIQTGAVTLSVTVRIHGESEEAVRESVDRDLDAVLALFQESVKNAPAVGRERAEQSLQKQIQNRKIQAEYMVQQRLEGQKSKVNILFKENERFQGKRWVEMQTYRSTDKTWELPLIYFGYGDPNIPETCNFLRWSSKEQNARLC